jgi:hypothetical protein
MPLLDWSQYRRSRASPASSAGPGCHTRLPVATIFENLEAGAIIDDIMAWYDGLDRDQVKAVIEFAASQNRTEREFRLARPSAETLSRPQAPLALELFLADAMCFIPVQFSEPDSTISQPYRAVPFISSSGLATQAPQSEQIADAAAGCDGLDVGEGAD